MKKLLKSILIMSILPLSACGISGKQKEGDLVTWEVTPQLIIKTELGLQRELIAYSPNSPQYRDNYNKYVGVFPFDYNPIKHQQLSVEEAKKVIESKNSNSKAHTLSFDLALNGAKFQPNDYIIRIDEVMVHEDQIRVEVKENLNNYLKIISEDEIKKGKYNKGLSARTNLDCYEFEKTLNSKTDPFAYKYNQCIGKPKNNSIPVLNIKIIKIESDQVIASYNSPELGVNILWRINIKHISDWEKIHIQIWNLINSWNVSPNI